MLHMSTIKPISSLEATILECRRRDALQFTQALLKVWNSIVTPHNAESDKLEAAILACQKRDRDCVKNALVDVVGEPSGPTTTARA
jgi:hypothetical protein